MKNPIDQLTPDGREELAITLVLLKEFKSGGSWNAEVSVSVARLAMHLGLEKEFGKMLAIIPLLKIEPR